MRSVILFVALFTWKLIGYQKEVREEIFIIVLFFAIMLAMDIIELFKEK